MTLKRHCKEYLLLEKKEQLLNFLLIYDLDNIDLQIKLLKNCYEIKDCKKRMKEVLE